MTRRGGLLAATILGSFAATFGAGAAKADPNRLYCFTPGANVYEYKGVTNEPTETTLINPNGSFSDAEVWNGAYSSIHEDGVCLGKLPPGPNDNLIVGPVSNGTTFVSTTIGGGGAPYASLFVDGAPPKSGVTLTLDTNGSQFATSVTAQTGQVTFNGGLSAGTSINLTDVDLQNPAQYTLAGGTYSATTAIFISGQTIVTAPSGATLRAPEVHLDGDLELGGKVMAASFLTVGEFGFGRLNIQSGAEVTSGNGFIGGFAGSNGSVIVNGKWTTTGELIDGQLGTGALTVGAGGQVTTGDFMTVGAGVGLSTLTINGGGMVSVTPVSGLPTDLALNTAVDPRSIAVVEVDGAGSVLNINGALNVGYAGTATMNVTTGAIVNVSGSIVRIGRMAGSTGTLNLTGASSSFVLTGGSGFPTTVIPATFQVGTFGTGNLNLTGGFQLNTGGANVTIGAEAGSNGTALVSDPGTTWTIGSDGTLFIGEAGHGSLTVSNGGTLDLEGHAFFSLGTTATGIGDLTLSGAASSFKIDPITTFEVGDAGHGNLVLNQGFSLDMSGNDKNVFVGAQSTGVGFVSMTGFGTSWEIGGTLVVGAEGKGELDVTGGAALTVDTQVFVGETPQGGKLVLSGAGSSLTLDDNNVFTVGDGSNGVGTLNVNQGFHLDTGTTNVILGAEGNANGFALVSDPGTTWSVGGELDIGAGGSGGLMIANGATVTLQSDASLKLGEEPLSAGVLTLDGAGSQLVVTTGATVQIGVQGAGEIDIQNSATLDWSAQTVVLGAQSGASGTIQVLSGGTFNVKNLTIGELGGGELDVGAPGSKATLNVLGITQLAAGDPNNNGFDTNTSGPGAIAIDGGSQATFTGALIVGAAAGAASFTLDNASSVLTKRGLDVATDDSDAEVTLLHSSSLTVQGGSLDLGTVGATSKLSIQGSSTVEADGGFTMGGSAELSLSDGSTFNSTAASVVTIGGSNSLGFAQVEVMSGSHLTLTGGAQIIPDKTVSITVDGAGSTLTADFLTSQSAAVGLDISNGAQVTLKASACNCEALTWPGLITLASGGQLTAPTASLGGPGIGTGLIAINSGVAGFSQYLKMLPGSMLDVSGGGEVLVGPAGAALAAGTVTVTPGGILKGVAGAQPAVLVGDLKIVPGGLVAGTLNVYGMVRNGGAHVLGDDPSSVTVNGSYTLDPTGVIVAEIGPVSYSQLIVNGPLILNGGTLEFEPVQGGTFKIGTTYNVLTASGGVTGNFAAVTVVGMPFIELDPTFVDGSLEVTALHTPGSFASVAANANQHAVASALDRAAPTATGMLGDFVNMLSNSDAAIVQDDFDPLSGEAYGAFAGAGIQANRDFAATLRGAAAQTSGREGAVLAFNAPRQSLAADGAAGDPSVWMAALGSFDHASGGVSGAHSAQINAGGLAGGVDLSPAPHWAIGGAFGYVHSDLGVGPEGSGTLATYQGALYGGYSGARLYVDAAAGYAQSSGALQRQLAPAAVLNANGQVRANQYFASGEAGLDLGRWNGALLTPFAALDAVSYDQAALSETGAAGLGLAIDGRRTDSVRSDVGLQLSTAQHGAGSPFEASFRIGWGHEFADPARPVAGAFIGAPDVPFTVEGAPGDRDFAVIGVGFGARLRGGVSVSARYDANLSSRTSEQLLSLDARVAW
jgi:fibronectin-binding autotransporter adhesin